MRGFKTLRLKVELILQVFKGGGRGGEGRRKRDISEFYQKGKNCFFLQCKKNHILEAPKKKSRIAETSRPSVIFMT